jgi:hypothetical protein
VTVNKRLTLLPFADVFVPMKVRALDTFEVAALNSFTVHPYFLQVPFAVLVEVLVLPLATVIL